MLSENWKQVDSVDLKMERKKKHDDNAANFMKSIPINDSTQKPLELEYFIGAVLCLFTFGLVLGGLVFLQNIWLLVKAVRFAVRVAL